MLEIEEVIPFYLRIDEDEHTTNPFYARNQEMVKLFEEFNKAFHVVVDDYGRLICTERKK